VGECLAQDEDALRFKFVEPVHLSLLTPVLGGQLVNPQHRQCSAVARARTAKSSSEKETFVR
jgi:hypothetical protein